MEKLREKDQQKPSNGGISIYWIVGEEIMNRFLDKAKINLFFIHYLLELLNLIGRRKRRKTRPYKGFSTINSQSFDMKAALKFLI